MKHVFLVHSHITHLMALQIVKEEKLAEDDCVFILERGFKSNFKNTMVNVFPLLPNTRLQVQILFWKTRKQLQLFDSWVSQLVQNKTFRFYAVHSNMNFFHAMISHKSCKGFSYIEEGLGSYKPTTYFKNLKKDLWLRNKLYDLNFNKRVPSTKDFFLLDHPKLINCYGIHPIVFPDIENKVILQPPFSKKEFSEDYAHVIVLSPHVEYRTVTLDALIASLKILLERMMQMQVTTAHIKFHPAQTVEGSINEIRNLLAAHQSKIAIIEIEANVSLEEVAISTKANFYIILSSVGVYASLMGCRVYSFANILANISPNFREKMKSIPDSLWNEINVLE